MTGRLLNRAGDGLFAPGLDRAWLHRLKGRVLCLVYHRVTDEPPGFLEWGGVPTMTTAELGQDLSHLREWGVRFMTFEQLRQGSGPQPDRPNFIISFDDGLRDTYENGLAVLDALDIKGVVFQVGELVDGVDLNWEHDLYRYAHQLETRDLVHQSLEAFLPAASHGTRDMRRMVKDARDTVETHRLLAMLEEIRERVGDHNQRRALAERLYPRSAALKQARMNGHEVGSHGMRHMARRFLGRDEFSQDLRQARVVIESAVGEPPGAYAYPFGCHQADDAQIVAGCHEQAALATPGVLDPAEPYGLNRCLWPGPARNELRRRRWLLTGRI